MTDADDPSAFAEPADPPTVGAELRAAREGSGLSIDDVAQQLKLAPRQVRALEDDDYAKLPGRTFVRGFVRNYARAFGLDAEDLVARLPGGEPSLERPTITPSGRPMGALPTAQPPRNWARWAIPLLLVAIVGAAGVYELRRPDGEPRRVAAPDKAAPTPAAPATTVGGTTSAALPNPFADAPADAGDPGSTPSGNAPAAAPLPEPASAPGSGSPGAMPASAGAAPTAAAPAATGEPLLVLKFKAAAWVQVKDRNGTVLLAQNGQAGTTQAVSGPLPFDVVIGNADDVTATFRGQPVDLSPFVRGNVARLSLK